jgi:hypothetical protein
MAYRKKAAAILHGNPDIAIIPECEHPDKLNFPAGVRLPTDSFWAGVNKNKGIGIFSYGDYRFSLHKRYKPDFRNIVPLVVTGGKIDFTLFAIWANNPLDKGYEYIGQVWKALRYYEDLLRPEKTILAGDFNSNTIWDKPRREGNHSSIVALLETKKIYSSYHVFHKQQPGQEKHNTLFMYRKEDKGYHIDYCFASRDFLKKLVEVKIGEHKDWSGHSDHSPHFIKFRI